MPDHSEAALLGHLVLTPLDFRIGKLFDPTALHAHEMIVVLPVVELENRLAGFEMMAFKQARLLELRQHPIDSRQANVGAFVKQLAIDIFRRKMPHRRPAEKIEDGQTRPGGLQTDVFEFSRIGHDDKAMMATKALGGE